MSTASRSGKRSWRAFATRFPPSSRIVPCLRWLAAQATGRSTWQVLPDPFTRRTWPERHLPFRHLSDGTSHQVLKNFPSEAELRAQVGVRGTDVKYTAYRHYWLMAYRRAA